MAYQAPYLIAKITPLLGIPPSNPFSSSLCYPVLFMISLKTRNIVVESSQVKPNSYWVGSYWEGTQLSPSQVRLRNITRKGA
jgi:hypothetical protein